MAFALAARLDRFCLATAVVLACLLTCGGVQAQVTPLAPPPPGLTPGERMTVSIIVDTPSEQRFGSGFVATEHGYIITSFRLVAGARSVDVIFQDQTRGIVDGHVGMHAGSDLILLKLRTSRQLTDKPLMIASQNPKIDDDVKAICGALGVLHPNNVQPDRPSLGKITAYPASREIEDGLDPGVFTKSGLGAGANWLQTSASVTADHRGGPILNVLGEVVGMTLWTPELDSGRHLAVPASELARLLKEAHPALNSQAHNLDTLSIHTPLRALPAPPRSPPPPISGQKPLPSRFQQNLQQYLAHRARLQVVTADATVYQQQFDALESKRREVLVKANAVDVEIRALRAQIEAAKRKVEQEVEEKVADKDGKKKTKTTTRVTYVETARSRELALGLPNLQDAHFTLLNEARGIVMGSTDSALMQRARAEQNILGTLIDRRCGGLLMQLCELPGMPVRKDGPEVAAELSDRLSQVVDRTTPAVYELVARGLVYQQLGKIEKAATDFDTAAQKGSSAPTAQAFFGRGVAEHDLPARIHALAARAYLRLVTGKTKEGQADFKEVLDLDHKDPFVFVLRGLAYTAAKDFSNAERTLKQALLLAPARGVGEADVQRLLALLYATCPQEKVRDSAKALKAAQKSCELTHWRDWACVDALAAAYAEAGQFDQAKQWSQAAADLADPINRAGCLERHKLYEAGKPLRFAERQ